MRRAQPRPAPDKQRHHFCRVQVLLQRRWAIDGHTRTFSPAFVWRPRPEHTAALE